IPSNRPVLKNLEFTHKVAETDFLKLPLSPRSLREDFRYLPDYEALKKIYFLEELFMALGIYSKYDSLMYITWRIPSLVILEEYFREHGLVDFYLSLYLEKILLF
ncbi:MAG: hypothetical protein QXO70_03685, partial [Candidatus Pacearchaeota archaeon]